MEDFKKTNPFKKYKKASKDLYQYDNGRKGIFIKEKFPEKYNLPKGWYILINIDVDDADNLYIHLRAGIEDTDTPGSYVISEPVPNFKLQPIGYFLSGEKDGWTYDIKKERFCGFKKEFSFSEFKKLLIHNFLHNDLNDFVPRVKSNIKLYFYKFIFWLTDSKYQIIDFLTIRLK